jgi:hypothetical protein
LAIRFTQIEKAENTLVEYLFYGYAQDTISCLERWSLGGGEINILEGSPHGNFIICKVSVSTRVEVEIDDV